MNVGFVAPELRALDALKCEALAVPFFEDERPLQGLLGLIDWRACGMISRMVVQGRLRGSLHETLLVPSRPRLSVEKLFLFGLGTKASFDEDVCRASTLNMLTTLTAAGIRSSAMVLPGRTLRLLDPMRTMEVFLDCGIAHPDHDEIMLVESLEGQRAMGPVVERERRRVRAALMG